MQGTIAGLMPYMYWTQDLEIGIDVLDHDHRQILDHVNDLHVRLVQVGDHEGGLHVLGGLIALVRVHFERERTLVRRHLPHFLDVYSHHYAALIDELESTLETLRKHEHDYTHDIVLEQLKNLFVLTVTRFCGKLKSVADGDPA